MATIQTPFPALTLTIGQQQPFPITPIFLPGQSFTDFVAYTLYLRQDPNYPRQTAANVTQANVADPVAEGWFLALQLSGTAANPVINFTIPSSAPLVSGPNRYSVSVWGSGGDAGLVNVFPETWVNVNPG